MTAITHEMHCPITLGAIGDALGAPYEQAPGDTPRKVGLILDDQPEPFTASTYLGTEPGDTTDDTGMTLALARALLQRRTRTGLDPYLVMDQYLAWYETDPKGVGGTVKRALELFRRGGNVRECGIPDQHGSGTVMRVSPLGVVYARHTAREIIDVTREDAHLTHRSLEAWAGSYLVARLISLAITRNEPAPFNPHTFLDDVYQTMQEGDTLFRTSLVFNNTREALRDPNNIQPGGAVYYTVPGAIATLHQHGQSVARTLKAAVNPGGDTDTRAAIAGNILGAYVTMKDIPETWLGTVKDRNTLLRTDVELQRLGKIL